MSDSRYVPCVPQKDHVVSSLDDLMKRYRPPVEEHRYTVKFVPIVDEDCSEEDIARIVSYDSRCVLYISHPFIPVYI